jgi:hypothetical protein
MTDYILIALAMLVFTVSMHEMAETAVKQNTEAQHAPVR